MIELPEAIAFSKQINDTLNGKTVKSAIRGQNPHRFVFTGKYSDEEYVTHPIRVSERVKGYTQDENVVAATILHDVLEDTDVDESTLREIFGDKITDLVVELTNPSKELDLTETSRAERKAVDREHLLHVSDEAKLIKLLDRIDNLNDLGGWPGKKNKFKELYANESLLLAEVIGNVNPGLYKELVYCCNQLLGGSNE